MDDLCAMILECNLIGDQKKWFLTLMSLRHVWSIKETFASYAPIRPDKELFYEKYYNNYEKSMEDDS